MLNPTLDLYWQTELCRVRSSAGQNSPKLFTSGLVEATSEPKGRLWNQQNTYKFTQSLSQTHTSHTTFNHFISKQLCVAEREFKKKDISPRHLLLFFLLFHVQLAYVYEILNGGG